MRDPAPPVNMRKNKPIIVFGIFILLISCSFPLQSLSYSECGSNPVVSRILSQTSEAAWFDWVEKLSGSKAVEIAGETTLITTRYSYAMFTGQPNARAFEYVQEQVSRWVPAEQVRMDPYPYTDAEQTYTWKNLVVTLPGTTRRDEIIVLSAHLDSTVVREGNPLQLAPGADDNASGVATLLEAVRIFSQLSFERTIKIIFFTGEEQRAAGSRAYVQANPTENIQAVLNLDMFGYDSTGDRCLELHVGTLPGSDQIGRCFLASAMANDIVITTDYLINQATDRSDHAAFWNQNVPAILVMGNFFENNLPGGCQGVDANPYYHLPGDTAEMINKSFAFDVSRVALATAANLARPQWILFQWPPF